MIDNAARRHLGLGVRCALHDMPVIAIFGQLGFLRTSEKIYIRLLCDGAGNKNASIAHRQRKQERAYVS